VDLWSVDLYNSLLVFSLLNILDIITTYNVLSRYGIEHEANPLARAIFGKLGIAGGFILKYLGMALIIVLGLFTNNLVGSIWVNNILLGGVVAWNSYVNYKASKSNNDQR
jgi:hypothetical protein